MCSKRVQNIYRFPSLSDVFALCLILLLSIVLCRFFSIASVFYLVFFFVCAAVVHHRTVELFTPFITMDRKHTHTLTLSHAYDSAVYSDFWGWSIRVSFCFAFVWSLFNLCDFIYWLNHSRISKTVDTLWEENEKKNTQRDRQRTSDRELK